MTLSFAILRLVVMPILVGIVASGMTEGYKRSRLITDRMRSTWAIRLVLLLCTLFCEFIVLVIWHEKDLLVWFIASAPANYGMGLATYNHFFKPLSRRT